MLKQRKTPKRPKTIVRGKNYSEDNIFLYCYFIPEKASLMLGCEEVVMDNPNDFEEPLIVFGRAGGECITSSSMS